MSKKIVFLITEDWFFYSHFLNFLESAQKVFNEVIIVTRISKYSEKLQEKGCKVLPLETPRGSVNPFNLMMTAFRLLLILHKEKPDVIHCISLPMIVLGGLAAKALGIKKIILAPVGLGHLWIENGWMERLGRSIIRLIISNFLHNKRIHYLFENNEDPYFLGLQPEDKDIIIINGTGINDKVFFPLPEPKSPPVKVAIVARMTRAKGIAESLAAIKRANEIGVPVELHLFGPIDLANRGSFQFDELKELCKEFGAIWHGSTHDIVGIWREHHICMLLSYREGLPKSLIEAIACARPVIATDVAGCRSVVRNEIEGVLVPLGDIEAAALAIVRLSKDPELRCRLGTAGNMRFQELYREDLIEKKITEVYENIEMNIYS